MKPKWASCAKLETKEHFSNTTLRANGNIYVQLKALLPSYHTISFYTHRTKIQCGILHNVAIFKSERDFKTASGSKPPAWICPPQDIRALLLISQMWSIEHGVEDVTSNPNWRQRSYYLFWIMRNHLELNLTLLPTSPDSCRHLAVLTVLSQKYDYGSELERICKVDVTTHTKANGCLALSAFYLHKCIQNGPMPHGMEDATHEWWGSIGLAYSLSWAQQQ